MPTITTNWYVSTNGSTWVTCASLGIERPILTLRANGLDELTFQVTGDFIGTAAFSAAAGQLRCFQRMLRRLVQVRCEDCLLVFLK